MRRLSTAFRELLPNITVTLPNAAGAAVLYLYFNYIDPAPGGLRVWGRDLAVFLVVSGTIIATFVWLNVRRLRPVAFWLERIRAGEDTGAVPAGVRRRALNAPLANALSSLAAWGIAGLFFFGYQRWVVRQDLAEALRVLASAAFLGGPVASSLSFLVAEHHWRRRIPLFFPRGRIDRAGVFRVPVLVRLEATFLVTAVMPPFLMLLASASLAVSGQLPVELRPVWANLVRTQAYIVATTGLVSLLMAGLVARFVNRPVQVLRTAMERVAAGDLAVSVPVQGVDELSELSEHFNVMVDGLREAERVRDLFGRYVSPAVARQALERGIALGGERTHATAMFVDLRGFTAIAHRVPPADVVELLNEYYALVERVCDGEGGVVTQFLGDGVVVVFGGPLRPLADHALRAVRAAIALERALAARDARAGNPLRAGVGICTGDMIAGNVGAGKRVTYTIIGDAVNQAARLQAMTRDLGASILVTDSTRDALGAAAGLALRPCGAVPLRGIADPVRIHAVEA